MPRRDGWLLPRRLRRLPQLSRDRRGQPLAHAGVIRTSQSGHAGCLACTRLDRQGRNLMITSKNLLVASAAASCLLQTAVASAAPTLTGWANLPAQTTAPGPTSGQFAVTD